MNNIKKEKINKNIGEVLKEYRLKNKLTQEQIAEKLEISVKYISRIENGTGGLKIETLIKYMNILCITPNTIFENLITNDNLKDQLIISKKINNLSKNKMKFMISTLDLLKNI